MDDERPVRRRRLAPRTSSEVDLPALGTFYKTGFTYEAWVLKQSTKVDVGVLGTWVLSRRADALGRPLAGRYRLTLGGTSATTSTPAGRPPVGQWQHVAATYDGTIARIYIDGVEAASTTFTGNVGNSNTWRIGAYGSRRPASSTGSSTMSGSTTAR